MMDALRVKGVLNYSSLGDIHDKIPELHPHSPITND